MEDASASPPNPARWWFVLAVTGAVIVFGLIASLVVVFSDATRERDAALRWQQHSYEVVVLARTLDATIARSEASLGRFVLSGDKAIGRAYQNDWRSAGALIDRIDSQVGDGPTQTLIDALRVAYAKRGKELEDVALRTNYGQNSQAFSKFYDAGKSPSLREISQLLDDIDSTERGVLAQRSARAQATIDRSNRFGAILSVIGVILMLGAGFLGWMSIESWRGRVIEEVRNTELETAVADRTMELSEVNEKLRAEMITREAAEERLRQAQKMEAIGQLTGGIAHDFNNMLAVVMGGIELAQRRLNTAGGDAAPHLKSAMEGAARAAALTKRLLAFSRAEPLLPVAADPNELLRNMTELLRRSIGETIDVRVLPGTGAWPIFVDPHQFENAILNLAVNARDAMPQGGSLIIAVANTRLKPDEIEGAPPGDYVCVAVADSGAGMTEEVRARAFEPFFTTKAAGAGTGLGLSQIFGFVRQSGGVITIDSQPGKGTTMAMFLPRSMVEPAEEPRPPRGALTRVAPHAARTILVVEDDARVLEATVEALREIGHRAIPCSAPADARALLVQHPDIALVISDVLMPGQTGPELAHSLRADYPDLPVLFVTGFAGDIASAEAFGGHAVLRKPFTIAALDAAVTALIDPQRGWSARAA